MKPISIAWAVAVFLLIGCQTAAERPTANIDHADRIVRMFVERCLDYAGRPQLRLRHLAAEERKGNGVAEITDQVDIPPAGGLFPVRAFLLEGKELMKVFGSDNNICATVALEPPVPSLEAVIDAFQTRVDVQTTGTAQGGAIKTFMIAGHTTQVTGAASQVNAQVGIAPEGKGIALYLSFASLAN